MIDPAASRTAISAAAIERAAAKTGADFDYLLRTAVRESGLDPQAEAKTSTATGLFQFLEQSWFAMIKRHGAEHGFGRYADAIGQGRNGYFVADRQLRSEILALRNDPDASALMAGEYTNDAAVMLRKTLGREPDQAEMYMAHFLGPGGAVQFLSAAARGEPNAAALFPDAARANKPIFYAKDGSARSPQQIVELMGAKLRAADIPDIPALDTIPAQYIVADFRPTSSRLEERAAAENALAARREMRLDPILREPPVAERAAAQSASPGDMQHIALSAAIFTQLVASLDLLPTRENDPAFSRKTGQTAERSFAAAA
jgi:hypothetical protein